MVSDYIHMGRLYSQTTPDVSSARGQQSRITVSGCLPL